MSHAIEPKPGILRIAPYRGGESRLEGVSDVVKLSSNENPAGPPESAIAALRETAQLLHLYPPSDHAALRGAIAEMHGFDPGRIVCGAGSDELINLLCVAYSGPGTEVIHTEHGFSMYRLSALSAGAEPVEVAERERRVDADSILSAVSPRTRLVFIANPANPTGTMIGANEVGRLAAELPPGTILVLDGAYADYVDGFDGGAALVEARENVVMTRTFSKILRSRRAPGRLGLCARSRGRRAEPGAGPVQSRNASARRRRGRRPRPGLRGPEPGGERAAQIMAGEGARGGRSAVGYLDRELRPRAVRQRGGGRRLRRPSARAGDHRATGRRVQAAPLPPDHGRGRGGLPPGRGGCLGVQGPRRMTKAGRAGIAAILLLWPLQAGAAAKAPVQFGRPEPRLVAAPATGRLPAGRPPGPELSFGLLVSPRPSARPAIARTVVAARPRSASATGALCGDPGLVGAPLPEIEGRLDACGVALPVRISHVDGVALSQPATIDCGTARALSAWIRGTVRPVVGGRGGGISGLRVVAHYDCRTRNSKPGAKISQHGKGHAIDIAAFQLEDETEISVLRGWRNHKDRWLLKRLHAAACGPFNTVLGPGSDRFHQDHFHLDTARYRSSTYCR